MSIVAITALALLHSQGQGLQSPPAKSDTFTGKVTKQVTLRYLVHLPDEYEVRKSERFPLMLFLHGSGERGEDVQVVAVHGPMKEVAKGRKLPFIVIAPQCEPRGSWDADSLTSLLDHVEKKYRVDKERVYLTGLSMGGYGTWALAAKTPERFAAVAPICGGGSPNDASKLKDIPLWVTHGDKDSAVPLSASQQMVDALKAVGATNVRFDIIQGGGHDVWTDFYANDAFYSWLLSHKKKR